MVASTFHQLMMKLDCNEQPPMSAGGNVIYSVYSAVLPIVYDTNRGSEVAFHGRNHKCFVKVQPEYMAHECASVEQNLSVAPASKLYDYIWLPFHSEATAYRRYRRMKRFIYALIGLFLVSYHGYYYDNRGRPSRKWTFHPEIECSLGVRYLLN